MFLTRTERDTPPVMQWHVKHNRALHEHLFVLRVEILSVPWVASRSRMTVEEVAPNFWRAEARFGFMERPHIPELLTTSKSLGCTVDLDDVTYYVGHETVIGREDGKGLPRMAGRVVRRDGAQRHPCQRLLQPPQRSGRRDRAADRDLGALHRCSRERQSEYSSALQVKTGEFNTGDAGAKQAYGN